MMRRVASLLALSLGLSAACRDAGLEPPDDPVDGERVVLREVLLERFEDDRLASRSRVATLYLERAEGLARGEGVQVEVVDREAGPRAPPRAQISAPRGQSLLRTRVVTLEGGVTLTDADGRVLTTDAASFDAVADHLESHGPVTLSGENFRATGARLVGQPGRGHLEVEGPVRGTITPKP